ncbi:MipA/OmpV family protein [uncultured Paraglaciecola sp.]|uniref:MipA/OmpV family protein n=1 Tax=uncultured Paraglaciecola sp. TaxID=1765024 RepID=UPI0025922F06|nr:MipA/OmpV family protein [uncultured Paraglaciecola sp.]
MKVNVRYLLLILMVLSLETIAQEEITLEDDMRPVWEAGTFLGVFNAPEYPASNQSNTNVVPAPYFIYRGKTLRIGDGSIARAVAVDKSWYELDLSLAASFGANSDDNEARAGMPDLDFNFELGPQLRLRLSKFEFDDHGKGELFLNLQTRAVFSTDFSGIDHRGYVFQPELRYRQRGWLSEKTALSISLSPTWASEKLHDYFYQVNQEFVTAQRSAYDAKAGYLGTRILLNFSFNATENIRVFLGVSSSIHNGAANEDSPLFIDNNTYSFGAGMVWRLWESQEKVAGR